MHRESAPNVSDYGAMPKTPWCPSTHRGSAPNVND